MEGLKVKRLGLAPTCNPLKCVIHVLTSRLHSDMIQCVIKIISLLIYIFLIIKGECFC